MTYVPGPVAPTAEAEIAVRPVDAGAVRLDPGGLLGAWQERNARATLPHCVEHLESAGNLDNVRRVTGAATGPFRGMWFADSDIHKTLEAAAWELGRAPDAPGGARDFIAATAPLLAAAQDDDGYLDSYFQAGHPGLRWREPGWSHELYCAGHLIQAAIADQRAGTGLLMPVARRLADLLVRRFGADGEALICGHPEIETALAELYRATGHRPYLDLAARMLDLRGHGLLGTDRFGPQYAQDHIPVRAATGVAGHAVRQLYLLAGMVDVATETGDRDLLAAAERLWDDAYATKTYLTGGHGSRHRDEAFGDPYELPPDRAYAESCAAVASFQWNWRLLLATGRHRYADEMERTLYNAVAAATARDGRAFFYANPLHLRTGHDGGNEESPVQRRPWYTCPCCPPNLARLMAALQTYLVTTDDDGVRIHLYGAGTVRAGGVRLEIRTDYPWDGRIEVTVADAPATPWTLALRVPGWCAGWTAGVDGAPVAASAPDGYLRLTRVWPPGTTVTLHLDMPPRLVTAHPRVDAVRGCAALARGPLVYCLEQADLPAGVTLDDVRLDPAAPVTAAAADGLAPVTLTASGTAEPPSSADLYDGPRPATTPSPLHLTAVPYFLWANRTPGAMRVWIPLRPSP